MKETLRAEMATANTTMYFSPSASVSHTTENAFAANPVYKYFIGLKVNGRYGNVSTECKEKQKPSVPVHGATGEDLFTVKQGTSMVMAPTELGLN